MPEEPDVPSTTDQIKPEGRARRDFLTKSGRFAAVTAPAITLLLGTSLNSRAIAGSTGSKPAKPGWGFGDENHDHDGPPGLNKKD